MISNFKLHQATYEWTVKAFSRIRKHLSLNIKLHGDPHLLEEGEIFVFNHFARIETFLPHYLIYEETGAFCRSIGAKSLFDSNDAFAKYLIMVGVIPNDCDDLLPLLVADIISGRKVIIFPEGGMVKDRKVVDSHGKFRIYSKEAKVKRKHHSGAAVIAYAVNTVKQAIVCAELEKNWTNIDHWLEMLGLDDRDQLLFSAHKPTTIIPCNITFFPINNDKTFLSRLAVFINNDLGKQAKEELIIESNLLLKDTDMDMRLGNPITLSSNQSWWEKKAQLFLSKNLESINHFFTLDGIGKPWVKIIQRTFRQSSGKVRDKYMSAIYRGTTINILHLASSILLHLFDENQYEFELRKYYLCVYLAIKNLQLQNGVNLHRGLINPEGYIRLVFIENRILKDFLNAAEVNNLIKIDGEMIHLNESLRHDFARGTVRIKNMIQVYANEMTPISGAIKAVENALNEINAINQQSLSYHLHDDELRSYRWNHQYYNKARFDEVNQKETASESGQPFLLLPKQIERGKKTKSEKTCTVGVVLVHGFLASPAEIKPLADLLYTAGYPVYGVRMAGHGTSPVDLREKSWHNWIESVRIGCKIVKPFVEKIVLLGFSTGSIVSFIYATKYPNDVATVIGVNSPVKFLDKKMRLVPLIHQVDKVISSVSPLNGIMPYRPNNSEHPDINYFSIPVNGLYELLQMLEQLKSRLSLIRVPCLLIQSSQDPIISKDSASILRHGLSNADVTMVSIDSQRHGIIYESVGVTHEVILDYINNILELLESDNDCVREDKKND